uniref:Rho GTPase activating protein 12 n=1 Tax=Paramormyrops kingsleyae TaxID=1676925 RepID=A0A3B3TAS8_9TELE
MADRDGRAEVPVAPGQTYIEVEYDYEYTAKDKLVSIRQGEWYMLVRKTNDDWWQVRKDEDAKAFYVPAQYVREVRKALMPPGKSLHPVSPSRLKPDVLEIRRSDENLNRPQEMSSFGRAGCGRPSPPSLHRDTNQNLDSFGGVPESVQNNNLNQYAGPGFMHMRPDPPNARAPDFVRSPVLVRRILLEQDVDRAPVFSDLTADGPEKLRNDSESGDDLSSSSTEPMQTVSPMGAGMAESPVYTNLQELKISQSSLPPQPSSSPVHALGDWETHRDTSGRHFYFNRATQERTWKPPRARDATSSGQAETPGSAGDIEPLSLEENCYSTHSSQSDSQYGSPPCGWFELLDEHGHTLYVSEYTNEKWIKHMDDQGRPYYYSADGSRSEWELPKYRASLPQPMDVSKSHSLDRKQPDPIVLTKWRHSTCMLDLNDKPSEKCGVLNVTKITDNGKKVRKSWTSSWTVLQGTSLLFAKGQGGGTSWFGGNQSKPEFTVDLRGGSVEWASRDKSSKKHVIEAWESDEAIEDDFPESPGVEKQDKEKDHRDKKNRALKSSSSIDSDQKKTRMKLKKFLTRRPTLQAVRDKGYIKDQVFGCSLTSLCQREDTTVPNFVCTCIDHVERTGLNVDGLYRVSGNLAVIQKLRFAVNHDEKVDLNDGKWEDIHVTTGALKMFFRELPEPLFTYGQFNDFVNAISKEHQRVHSIKDLIRQLPKPNQDTMQVLFRHLRKVVEHGDANRMTTQSMAIVFGPTLLRPETETASIAVHMVYQNQIVELILLEFDGIFGR